MIEMLIIAIKHSFRYVPVSHTAPHIIHSFVHCSNVNKPKKLIDRNELVFITEVNSFDFCQHSL